ncbi:MAG: hypothetical protein WBD40_01425, partial [Tepidisphaeraceae bacterium]
MTEDSVIVLIVAGAFLVMMIVSTVLSHRETMQRLRQPASRPVEESMAETPESSNSGVPRGESDALAQIYAEAAKRLKQIVLHPPGTKESSRQFNQARAAQLVAQVEQLRRELGQQAALWIGRNVPAAY